MPNEANPVVLLVEDNEHSLDIRTKLFTAGGFTVVGAHSFGEAVQKMHDTAVDLFVTDINLEPSRSDDKSGLYFAEFVRRMKPGIPIVGYSAWHSSSEFDDKQIALFDDYQFKGESGVRQILQNMVKCRDLAIKARQTRDGQAVYDVFLSYNTLDKQAARRLAKKLRDRNVRVWFDEWELPPGKTWQDVLEKALTSAKSAIVAVGKYGVGRWESREIEVLLDEHSKRGVPIIPVVLPGTTQWPDLPAFLRQFVWVDLRTGLRREALDHLQWGITGANPRLS